MSIRDQVRRCLLIEVDDTPRWQKLHKLSQDPSTTDAERDLAAQKSREAQRTKTSVSSSDTTYYHTGYHQPSKIKSQTQSALEPLGFKFHKSYRFASNAHTHVFKHEDGREISANINKSRKQDSYWQPSHKKTWTLRSKSLDAIDDDKEYQDVEKNTKKFDTLKDLVHHLNPDRIE